VRFIIDAQLPPDLARVLRENSFDAVAVREVGLRDANDTDIWRYAVQQDFAIITKDEDFADRCLYDQNQPVIVWLRIGNCSNRALLQWLLPLWPEVLQRIRLGDRLIEVS
jgi:predicted nuclease of predicted toxin-antitoxin system